MFFLLLFVSSVVFPLLFCVSAVGFDPVSSGVADSSGFSVRLDGSSGVTGVFGCSGVGSAGTTGWSSTGVVGVGSAGVTGA